MAINRARLISLLLTGVSPVATPPDQPAARFGRSAVFVLLLLACGMPVSQPAQATLSSTAAAPPRRAATWADIDQLRQLLTASGARVVQRDCQQPGLQGLYHNSSGTIVICRVHRDPAAVWNTLAHEATHRMQACAGGTITDPAHHAAMARALAVHAPEEWRSLRAYPRSQQLSELEARYTARLPPEQVPRLFRRYCGGSTPSSLSQRP